MISGDNTRTIPSVFVRLSRTCATGRRSSYLDSPVWFGEDESSDREEAWDGNLRRDFFERDCDCKTSGNGHLTNKKST